MAKKRRPDGDTPAKRTRRTIEETTQRSETIEEFEAKTGHLTRRIVRSENKDARITEDVQSGPGVNLDQSAALGRLPDDRTDRMVPDQWKVSIFDSFVDAPLSVADFAGDYLVSRVPAGAPEDSIAWESVFIENQGLSRLCVTARVAGRRLLLTVEIDGRVPGPRWTGVAGDDLRQPIRLQRDRTVPPAALANDDWPTSVLLVALTQSGRHATSEQLGEEQSGSRYHISPAPMVAERAMMAGGGSSSCSSSSGCQEPEPDPTPPCEESEEECCESDASSGPIRYFNGEVQLTVTDLAIRGFGSLWGQQRVYSNRLTPVASTGNGVSWLVEQWPYLIESNDLSITMVKGTRQALWFDVVGSDYEARFGAKSTLVHDAANEKFVLTRPGGEQWLFHDFDQTTNPPGIVSGHITAGGQATEVASYTAQDQIAEITRSMVVSGQTTTASFLYSYTSGGDLESVLYQTRVDTGAWNEIRRVQYEYYGSTDLFGNLGDLKRSRVQVPAGSGWTDTKIRYYRYYTANTTIGFQHGLKFVLNPAAYNRMLADSLDPQLAGYANFYYEYDSQRRATREIVDAGSRTFTFAYTQNAFPDDYNNWKVKTVETLPDATQNIVYTNYIGQILIKEHKSGTDRWIEYFQFSSDGRKTLAATPAAVIDYDDSSADLNVNLRTAAGKIHLTEYYTSSGGVGAKGYVQARKIQQGTSGTPITLQAIQYTSRTANGVTVYPVSQRTVYRNDDASGAISTSYAYTWYTATVQQKERIATLPVVSTSQNGSGVAATRKEYFDEHGYAVWSMNERGFISRRMVDVPTGAITKTIEDVDTSLYGDVPSGWVTPSGGGLNLVTDYDNDDLGRPTQTLGPVYTIDLSGTATPIRSADWTVYADDQFTVRTGRGYRVVADSSFTLINPVNIAMTDAEGRPEQEIRATRGSGVTSSGKLLPTDSFAQSSYTAWATTQYIDCCIVASQRVYHTIPASGAGSAGTHYEQTSFGYDVMKRRNRTITPGGTITFDVFNPRGQSIETWVGTDDTGATSSDPSGGGATGNNMVQITGLQYDDGIAGGNGNLTQQTQFVDGSTTRVTSFEYDWRDRRTTIDAEEDLFEKRTYDNLDRVVKTQRYDTTASGNLVALSETRVDDRGHVYQSVRYGVDPATGAVGNSLTDNTWFDAAGNPIKELPAGSSQFTKTAYDSLGRDIAQYQGYDLDETSYADAGTVNDDTIIQQSETTYDSASNAIEQITRQRYHNAPATQTGTLQTPSLTPNARVTYTALYPDAAGRNIATADFGTNGGTALARPATVPARSDTVLVTTTAYNNAGQAFSTIDAAGKESRTIRDAMSRTTIEIENYQASGSGSDVNVTTEFTYTADSQIKTLTAKMSSPANDEVTTYVYGVSPATGSQLTVNTLLLATEYPEDTSTKREEYAYNRQQERIEKTDQNGTVHGYDFDGLGRPTQDRITTVGTGVDSAVRRVETSYDVRGQVDSITCLDNAMVGSGTVLNQIVTRFNDFGQLSTEFIAHSGTVNTSTSPKIQYSYADGSSNQTRLTSVTYPGGREIDLDYGTSGGIDDSLSRVQQLIDGGTTLVDYSYLGKATPVQVSYPQPDVTMDLWDSTTGTYAGLDRFGRIVDLPWIQDTSGTPTDLARIVYGYNRASSPTYARDEVARAHGADLDQLYSYDGLPRLIDFEQGQLNAGNTAISSSTLTQDWDLDQVGNWDGFHQGVSGVLDQTRTHNRVNEIADISNGSGQPVWIDPAYDAAGNMTLTPRLDAPTAGFTLTYDAWNRITTVETADVSPELVAKYGYDGRNHRISKEVYDAAGSLESTIKFFYNAAWQCLEERETPVGGSSSTSTYVWGQRYIDDLVCRDDVSDRLYALQDRQYKTLAVLSTGGTVQERYSYTPYGKTFVYDPIFTLRTASAFDWVYLYTGRRLDPETNLYYFRNRYYDPSLGRFFSRDPIESSAGEKRFYEYVSNNPGNYTDPLGLKKVKISGPPEGTNEGCTKEGNTKFVKLPPIKDIILTGGVKTVEVCDLPAWLICDPKETKGERECIRRYTTTISGKNLEEWYECRKNDDGLLEWFYVGIQADDTAIKKVWGKKSCKSCWPAGEVVNV